MMTTAHAQARVLIVDDQPDTTAALTVLLTLLGYETRSAHRGRDAIWIARDYEPDLVLLDIRLPDLDGCEVARALRSRSASRSVPFIAAMSGLCRPQDRERAYRAGIDEYLMKPIDLPRLRGLFRAWRDRKSNDSPPPHPN